MAGARKCCCDSCICPDGTKISSDGTVEWITHTVDSGVITVVDHEGPCITYWVDSDAGDQTETGDGTELDPWININTVFADACIKHICTHQDSPDGCPKVKILTKGTIDYTVNGGSYNYGRNLIFEPWDVATIEVSVSGAGTVYGVKNCVGVVWKNAEVGCASTNGSGRGFQNCHSSIFDNCTGTGTGAGGYAHDYGTGFYSCYSSTFHDCDGTGTGVGISIYYSYSSGFYSCYSSTFDNCNGVGNCTSYRYGRGSGFRSCYSSTFNNCEGDGTGTGLWEGSGYGFFWCYSSTFDTCTGNGTGATVACGFDQNTDSSFLNCGPPYGGVCDV